MKNALILGLNGTFGSHMARALRAQGYRLRALVRDRNKVAAEFADVELVEGEVSDRARLLQAARGMEVMVYGVNPANYDWEGKALPWLEAAAQVAEERGMCLLFPGNVYVYDPQDGPEYSEASEKRPHTRRGQIRLAMERRLQAASTHGAQVIIVRAGDFIAADSSSAWLQFLLRPSRSGYHLKLPGDSSLTHSWAYLPDLAASAVRLLQQRHQLPAFNEFLFRGYRCSFEEMAEAIEEATGRTVKLGAFPWWAVRLVAPFSVMFRGLQEMRYLWQYEINLSGEKLRSVERGGAGTPLATALQEAGLI